MLCVFVQFYFSWLFFPLVYNSYLFIKNENSYLMYVINQVKYFKQYKFYDYNSRACVSKIIFILFTVSSLAKRIC